MHARREHIIPVGDDIDRKVGPTIEMRADVLYLLAHGPDRTGDADQGTGLPDGE